MRIEKLLLVVACFLVYSTMVNAGLQPKHLTCEYLTNPPLIDSKSPRLSWINVSNRNGELQTAYQIQVASSPKLLANPDLWDTGKVKSNESVLVHYAGNPLKSRQNCYWRVRTWDKKDKVSQWSEIAHWSMGLLNKDEWIAKWIGAPWEPDEPYEVKLMDNGFPISGEEHPAPLFRKNISVAKKVVDARIYICGLGYFELYLNGQKVCDDVLVPNFTNASYRKDLDKKRVAIDNTFRGYNCMYLCYNLTDVLREGSNTLECLVGNGFWNSKHLWSEPWGAVKMIAQLYIKYNDGTEQLIPTDSTWQVTKSAIVRNGIFLGEDYDARRETYAGWQQSVERDAPEGVLEAQQFHSDKIMEVFHPLSIRMEAEGKYIVSFPEEIAGWVHLKNMKGEVGRKINIKYICESPQGTSSYIMRGKGEESYHPHFTWFVFRNVEISNYPGNLRPQDITAEAVYTEMKQTGNFECSDTLLNRINHIFQRTLKDNAHGGIISDCPHRERAAYTGDGQVCCQTVMHNFEAAPLYTKWMRDIYLAQNPKTGYVPNGAPWQTGCGGGPAWGAAMNIIPWEFYRHYGDKDMLESYYEEMKMQLGYMQNWVDEDGIMLQRLPTYWHNLGEWCCPSDTVLPEQSLVHTYFYWKCAVNTSKASRAIGKINEARKYAALAERTRQAFHKRFYDGSSKTYGVAGSNIFALAMGWQNAIYGVKADLKQSDGHVFTGIFGTQLFFETLADNGMNEEAYNAMIKRDFPSYGYWIAKESTTMWEHWNGADSHNHPMFGGALTWLYRKVAGMDVDENAPGFRHIIIRPMPPQNISWARYSTETPYGKASVEWHRVDRKIKISVVIPVGSTATIYMPSERVYNVGSGKYILE